MFFTKIIIKVSYYNFPDYLIRTGDLTISKKDTIRINYYSRPLLPTELNRVPNFV